MWGGSWNAFVLERHRVQRSVAKHTGCEGGTRGLTAAAASSRGSRAAATASTASSNVHPSPTLPAIPRSPGVFETMASELRPVSMLIRLDLPTLERPMTAKGRAGVGQQSAPAGQVHRMLGWPGRATRMRGTTTCITQPCSSPAHPAALLPPTSDPHLQTRGSAAAGTAPRSRCS